MQGREVSAEAAAGVYMEDRAAQLECLHFLLQAQALRIGQQQQGQMPEPVSQALTSATEQLLAPQNGKHVLLERLVHLIMASPCYDGQASMPSLKKSFGIKADASAFVC